MLVNRTSPTARIETLESRRLLSAAPLSAAAVHTHPTVPTILGRFDGIYIAKNRPRGVITITFTSEGTTGKLGGTLVVAGIGTINIAGTVNAKNKISFHGSIRHTSVSASGSVFPEAISGNFNLVAKQSVHGTFSTNFVIPPV